MKNIGLVLEGGGMRGVYTAGVLDFFMDQNVYFPYVIGVSAGACNGLSYVAKQRGRSRDININYADDPRYISYRNLVRNKSIFGMDFLFDEIPNKLVPFDYNGFNSSDQRFVVGTTDCLSGEPVYFCKGQCKDIISAVKASSSLPMVSQVVNVDGKDLLDGGIVDPIPIRKAMDDGYNSNIVVLTRNKGYRKKPLKIKTLVRKMYPQYPGLVDSMINRYRIYNDTIDYIEELEKQGKIVVIRPTEPIKVSRIEKNKDKLLALYDGGYRDAKAVFESIEKWIN